MRLFTIWLFRGVTIAQDVTVAKYSEPNDKRVQHKYQTVLAQVWACSPGDALVKYTASR